MVCKWGIPPIYTIYRYVITHLLTSWDIQVNGGLFHGGQLLSKHENGLVKYIGKLEDEGKVPSLLGTYNLRLLVVLLPPRLKNMQNGSSLQGPG